ncbi:MAG: hypothetical protein LIP01_01695 [Tannerellaceae bacterium]|nr:hypothetical protein [Tannerellaceae bacterium]
MPLGYKNPLEHFSLTTSVFHPESKPRIIQAPHEDCHFSKEITDYSFTWQSPSLIPEGELLLAIPFEKESLTFIEKGSKENEVFFIPI